MFPVNNLCVETGVQTAAPFPPSHLLCCSDLFSDFCTRHWHEIVLNSGKQQALNMQAGQLKQTPGTW